MLYNLRQLILLYQIKLLQTKNPPQMPSRQFASQETSCVVPTASPSLNFWQKKTAPLSAVNAQFGSNHTLGLLTNVYINPCADTTTGNAVLIPTSLTRIDHPAFVEINRTLSISAKLA